MTVKKPQGKGENGPREVPDDDNHRAAIVAVIDLGTHPDQFPGQPPADKRFCAVAYEILDQKKSDGSAFVMAETYTLSLHEKATLRKVVEAARGPLKEGHEFDFDEVLGKIVRLTVTHKDNDKQGDERRVYARLEEVGLADKRDRGQRAKTDNVPFQCFMDDGAAYRPHDWMPWVWFRPQGQRMALEEIIAKSREAGGPSGKAQPPRQGGQPVPPSASEDDIPF